jgi:WD40 repeat protein
VQGESGGDPSWHRSPGGKYLASRVSQMPLRVLAQPDQTVVAEFDTGKLYVQGEWFSPDDRYFAVSVGGGKSSKTVLWNLAEKREIATLPAVLGRNISFSPDSKLVGIQNAVWETATGQKMFQRERPANTAVFSPSGKRVAFTGRGPIEVWDISAKAKQRTINLPREVSCQTVVFDPGETRISTPPTVTVWDLTSGEQIPTFFGRETADSVAFSSDGRRFHTLGGGSISVFSDRSWNLLLKFRCPLPRQASELDGIFQRIMLATGT